jgi:hypothetical protein
VGVLALAGQSGGAKGKEKSAMSTTADSKTKHESACTVYEAAPERLILLEKKGAFARCEGGDILLGNGCLTVRIPADKGVIASVASSLSGMEYPVTGDTFGFAASVAGVTNTEWMATPDTTRNYEVTLSDNKDRSGAVFTAKEGGLTITITYTLDRRRFWVERNLAITTSGPTTKITMCRLVYGALTVSGGRVNELKLGKFDKPRLVTVGNGGLFAGVGWWFYEVDKDGVYQNTQIGYETAGRFEAAPWYVGVLAAEPGEPFTGWLWYKNFLTMRKREIDKQSSWSYWNAGWGQWGIEMSDPVAEHYVELAARMGIRGIVFGSGAMGAGVDILHSLARQGVRAPCFQPAPSSVAENTLRKMLDRAMVPGGLFSAGRKWEDPKTVKELVEQVRTIAASGFPAAYACDFFETTDSFLAHRGITEFYGAARESLAYTENHLGMAQYGPQFQREVMVNHPDDLYGFDTAHFSVDWATVLGFRHSRREWQKKYQYLMPEYGLYYYVTHYSNWGHPRQYTDPEPQQFLYPSYAYCGIAFNFHDRFGFRDSVAAAAAFSPYYVFGHLELRMPKEDVEFARRWLEWVEKNADALVPDRICMENDNACVVSKVCGCKGPIFLLNYGPGRRTFHLTLQVGATGDFEMRQVYPTLQEPVTFHDGQTIEVSVRGESLAIMDVNESLKSFPPVNPAEFPVDVTEWKKQGEEWSGGFHMPEVRSMLAASADSSLPRDLLSIEQDYENLDAAGKKQMDSQGKGKLPDGFLRAYSFRDGKLVETWKIAPWAFADRVWLVYHPPRPLPLNAPFPSARVNGQPVRLFPRVNYWSGGKDWTAVLFFADVTGLCQYGRANMVTLTGSDENPDGRCFVISAAKPD